MEKPVYPPQTMYEIGGGDKHFCSFDFSILPDEQYEKFFNSLPNLIYKKLEKVSFNCDFQFSYAASGKSSVRKENLISDSIANKRPKFIPYLTKILKFVLPKSKTLKSIEFSAMHIPRGMLSIILSSISKSKSLDSVIFKNIQIHDEYVIRFLSQISPYQYYEVSFPHCGLTSACYPAIKTFIRQRPKTSVIDRKLTTMNLEGCAFSSRELATISGLINEGKQDDLTDGEGEPDITIDNNTIVTEEIAAALPSPRRQLLLVKGSNLYQNGSKSSKSPAKSIQSLQYQQMQMQSKSFAQGSLGSQRVNESSKKEANSFAPPFKMGSASMSSDLKERSPSRRMKEPPKDPEQSYSSSEEEEEESSYEESSHEETAPKEEEQLPNAPSVGSKQKPPPEISAPKPLVSSSGDSDDEPSNEDAEESSEEDYYSYSDYSVSSVESGVPENTADIAEQNERLKKQLGALMKQKKAVMYEDDVFLIGDNVNEVVETVNDWKKQVHELENHE